MLISAGAALIGYILIRFMIESGYMTDMDDGGRRGRSTALRVVAAMTFIGFISGVVALVIKGFINWIDEKKIERCFKRKKP